MLALEASRRNTLSAHTARHEALLRSRAERREQVRIAALRKIAPGFEPQGAPLVPVRVASAVSAAGEGTEGSGENERQVVVRQFSSNCVY